MADRPPGYMRLREFIDIDPAKLDEEIIRHAPLFLEVCEQVADAVEHRDKVMGDLSYLKAAIRRDLRENQKTGEKKLSNDDIDATVEIDREVTDATRIVEKSKADVAIWNALLEGYRAKASALKRLGELMTSGYAATSSVLRSPREQIREATEKRARKES